MSDSDAAKVVIWGVEYPFAETYTLGESADIEMVLGGLPPEQAKARLLLGMIWIAVRRKDPSWTLERVRQLDLGDFEVQGDPDSPPTEAVTPSSNGAAATDTTLETPGASGTQPSGIGSTFGPPT